MKVYKIVYRGTQPNVFRKIYRDIDPKVKLYKEQTDCVIDNSKVLQIIAGAGSGKTATVVAKVRYLTESEWGCPEENRVLPEEILVLSYSKESTKTIQDKLEKINSNAKVCTIHSLANSIVKEKRYSEYFDIERTTEKILDDFIISQIFEKEKISSLLKFYAGYFYIPKNPDLEETLDALHRDKRAADFDNFAYYIDEAKEAQGRGYRTLRGEYCRSHNEVQIANYLYLHGINYIYEDFYRNNVRAKVRLGKSKKFYTPDFHLLGGKRDVYLEHWGISEDLTKAMKGIDKKKYIKSMQTKFCYYNNTGHKIKKSENRKTNENNKHKYPTLLETFSLYKDKSTLYDNLDKILETLVEYGFPVKEMSNKDAFDKITKFKRHNYFYKFKNFLKQFIENYKSLEMESFEDLKKSAKDDRTKAFLDVADEALTFYKNRLGNDRLDYADMINEANDILEKNEYTPPYRWIIVDEFQDIAKSRFNLIKFTQMKSDAKLMVVGDDWQSIYEFAGSDLSYFRYFLEKIGSVDKKDKTARKLVNTHRNSAKLINAASGFVMKDKFLIPKSMESKAKRQYKKPIHIVEYDKDNLIKVVPKIVQQIVKFHEIAVPGEIPTILFLGRYKHVLRNLYSHLRDVKYEDGLLTKSWCFDGREIATSEFMTVHTSKGLDRDYVVLLDVSEGVFGFPSGKVNDPIFKFLKDQSDKNEPEIENMEEDNYEYAEERRLFYVALTRTKNLVFLLTPKGNPSRFVNELIEIENPKAAESKKSDDIIVQEIRCPFCGSRLSCRYNKNYKSLLYECTSEPDSCDYKTNVIKIPRKYQKAVSDKIGGCTYRDNEGGFIHHINSESMVYISQNFDLGKCNNPKCDGEKKVVFNYFANEGNNDRISIFFECSKCKSSTEYNHATYFRLSEMKKRIEENKNAKIRFFLPGMDD
jgi:DNA helicase-4